MGNLTPILFVLIAAMLWGTTGTTQALAPAGTQPLALGALRLIVGGLALLGAAAVNPKDRLLSRVKLPLKPVLLAAVCMAAYQVLFFSGVARTGVAVGTIVGIGSSPVLAGILGLLFRHERLGFNWCLATLLGIAGGGLLVLAGKDIRVDPLGILLAVGAGAAYATFSLVSKGLLEKQPVEKVMAVVFSLGAVLLSPLLLTQNLSWVLSVRGTAVVLHLGLLATALAYSLFGKGLRRLPLATAVSLSLAEPMTAGILGVTVVGEKLTLSAGIGIGLIFSGLVVLSAREFIK